MRLWLAVAIFLAGCNAKPVATVAQIPEQPSTKEEVQKAGDNLYRCLHQAANKYDDDKSDARTIGFVVNNECRIAYTLNIAAMTKGSGVTPRCMKTADLCSDLDLATSVVLQMRKLRAMPTPQ